MARKSLLESYRLNDKLASLVSHAILLLMMMCVGSTVMILLQHLVRDFRGAYLPWLCLFISLEAMFTWRKTRRWSDLNTYGIVYYAIEWVVLITIIKLFLSGWHGFAFFWEEIQLWRIDFMNNFFSSEMMLVTTLAFFIWIWTGLNVTDLRELEGDVDILLADDSGIYLNERNACRDHLVSRFYILGVMMIIVTAILQINFNTFTIEPTVGGIELLNILVYFLLGLVLLSQTQFSVLRASWAWSQVPIGKDVGKRWITFSAIFMILIAGISFILPTQYTLGLLTTLNYVFNIIISIISFLVFLIIIPFFSLISYLLRKLNIFNATSAPPLEYTTPEPPKLTQPGTPLPWLDVVKSLVFWAIFIGIIGYAFIQYIRQNKELLAKLRRMRGFAWLMKAWAWLRGQMGNLNQQLSITVKSAITRLQLRQKKASEMVSSGFISLRRLSPRQRVLFFYLALIRRGNETGIGRKPSQTPYEYAHTLSGNIKDIHQDVGEMTEAFIEARYSLHKIDVEKANTVREHWEKIRRAIRNLHKKR